MSPMKIILELKKAEDRFEKESKKLEEIRFELELIRSNLSNFTMRFGSPAEKEVLMHPKFPDCLSRLAKAIVD